MHTLEESLWSVWIVVFNGPRQTRLSAITKYANIPRLNRSYQFFALFISFSLCRKRSSALSVRQTSSPYPPARYLKTLYTDNLCHLMMHIQDGRLVIVSAQRVQVRSSRSRVRITLQELFLIWLGGRITSPRVWFGAGGQGVTLKLAWGPSNFSPWNLRFVFVVFFIFPLFIIIIWSSLSIIRVWKKSLQSDKSASLSRDTKRRRLWSSAELTRDVIISSVQIKNFKKPCTRSNATIATSTNKNALISQSYGPLLSSTAQFLQVQLLDLSLDAPSRYFMVILESLRLRVASGAHGSVHFLSWVTRKIDFTPASLVWHT